MVCGWPTERIKFSKGIDDKNQDYQTDDLVRNQNPTLTLPKF
jgi:hypothetical protein